MAAMIVFTPKAIYPVWNSTRPPVRLSERGKYDVIAVFAEVCFECARPHSSVCTAFFITFRAAPLPKMHEFKATLAEHADYLHNLKRYVSHYNFCQVTRNLSIFITGIRHEAL